MSEVSVKPSSEGGSRSKLPGIGEGDGGPGGLSTLCAGEVYKVPLRAGF